MMVTSTPAAPSIGNVLKQGEKTGVALLAVDEIDTDSTGRRT
jgi:hypothetical protein